MTFARRLIAGPGVATVPGSSFFSRPELGRTKVRFAFPKKLETLRASLAGVTGHAPTSFRAVRFGLGRQAVTALLATHRLQDGFALANFHFDPRSKKVCRDSSPESSNAAPTRFLVLRAGKIYFEGSPDELMKSQDPYLQRFLI